MELTYSDKQKLAGEAGAKADLPITLVCPGGGIKQTLSE
jgi:hypothetical protein